MFSSRQVINILQLIISTPLNSTTKTGLNYINKSLFYSPKIKL